MADWGFQIPGFAGEEDDELAKLFGMPYEMAKVPDQTINFDDIGGQSFSLPPVSSPSPFALEPLAAPAPAQELPSPEYMNPGRVSRLNEIDVALKELQKAQTERALASQTTPRMTGDQAFATTVASALPLILGRLFAGNSGGAIGGQVGLGIAKGAEAGYDKQNQEAQAKSKAEYDLGKIEQTDLTQQKRSLQSQGYAAEDALRMEGMRQGNREELFNKEQSAINQRSANSAGLRNQGINLREKSILGSESNRLSTKFQGNAFIKSAVSSINAANNIDTLMANPSSVTAGQAATQLAVLAGEVGVKTDRDISRNLGPTAGKLYVETQNYLTNNADSPLPAAQVNAIKQLTAAMRPLAEKKIEAVRQEIRGSGLAPLTEAKGLLDGIIMSLGSAADAINQAQGGGGQEQMIKIKNRKTGEEKMVPASEASKYGG